MKVLIAGSPTWDNYSEIMRKMTVVLDDWVSGNPEDKKIVFVHAGNRGAEDMVTEYIGKVERLIKQKGYAISEKVIGLRNFVNEDNPRNARDFAIISDGADKAIIFAKEPCARSRNFAKLTEAFDIPTEIVND
jgi:hypothetical protein